MDQRSPPRPRADRQLGRMRIGGILRQTGRERSGTGAKLRQIGALIGVATTIRIRLADWQAKVPANLMLLAPVSVKSRMRAAFKSVPSVSTCNTLFWPASTSRVNGVPSPLSEPAQPPISTRSSETPFEFCQRNANVGGGAEFRAPRGGIDIAVGGRGRLESGDGRSIFGEGILSLRPDGLCLHGEERDDAERRRRRSKKCALASRRIPTARRSQGGRSADRGSRRRMRGAVDAASPKITTDSRINSSQVAGCARGSNALLTVQPDGDKLQHLGFLQHRNPDQPAMHADRAGERIGDVIDERTAASPIRNSPKNSPSAPTSSQYCGSWK